MVDIYMAIDGLKGESTDSEHKDWIEVLSFSHSITQPASATSIAGGTSTRSQHQPYSITKHVDMASPKLYQMCCSGTHVREVTIHFMRPASSKRVKYMEVKLQEVLISHVAPSGGTEFPSETIGLTYGAIKWTYTQQRSDGSQGGNTTGGWNLTHNQAA